LDADSPFPLHAADALARVGRLLAETLDPAEVAARIADSVGRLLDPLAVVVYRLTADGDLIALAIMGDAGPTDGRAVVFPRGTGLGAAALATRATVWSDDILADPRVRLEPRERRRLERAGYRAALAVPLISRGRAIGVLELGLRPGRALHADARQVVEAFADQAALALDNARLHAESLSVGRRLELEHGVARLLAEADSVDAAIATLIANLADALGWRAGAFWRVAAPGGTLEAVHVWSSPTAPAPRYEAETRRLRFAPGEGLPGRAWAGARALWISDVTSDPAILRAKAAAEDGLHAAICVPVTLGGEVLGALELFSSVPLSIDDDLLATLASIGGQVGQFLERKRAEAALAASNRQLTALFESALDAVVIADDERRYVDANEAAAQLFGVRREALIGLRIDDFVVGSDHGGADAAWRAMLDAGEQRGEVTLMRPDGELRLIEYSARAHFVPGRHLSILRDVTGRRAAERDRELAQNRFAVVAELAQTLSQTLDPVVVGARVAHTARTLLRARASVLYRLADDGLVVVAVSGGMGPGFTEGLVLPSDTGMAGLAIRERRALASPDVLSDARVTLSGDLRARIGQAAYRAVLAVPLMLRDTVVGAFAIGDEPGRAFSPEEMRVAQTFADHAAIALENARIFALESARRAQMEGLATIERDLAAELEPERLLKLIIDHVGRFFRARAGLYLVSGARTVRRRAQAGGLVGPEEIEFGTGMVGRVAETRHGLIVNDYGASPVGLDAFRALGVRHGMAQPMSVHGRLLGVVGVGRAGRRAVPFTADEFDILGRLATQAAVAIDNARLYAEAARGQREAEVIAEVARATNEALDVNAILPLVADAARALTGAELGSVALREDDAPTAAFRYSAGQRNAGYHALRPALDAGVTGRVAGRGRVLRTADLAAEKFDDPVARWLVNDEEITALIVAPIAFGGRVEGFLFVGHRRRVGFTAVDEHVVQRLADQGATALRNVRLLAAEQAARSAAEAANRMKDEFLATVSHELRTPLTAMLGWIWWLRRGPGEEETRLRAIDTVERNARAQAQLVEDLLDVSRIVTGKLRLEVRPSDVREVIDAAIENVRTAADAKGIALEASLPAVPVTVSVDPDRLQQVVWNLLSNAVKFTPEAGRVEVRLAAVAGEVRIVVSDTGTGISPGFLPYVFDRFRQGEASSTRAYGGLGLGLAIVRHLVELHGGVVRAESEGEGRGTTFTVTLPTRADRRIDVEDELARLRVAERVPAPRSATLDGVHVLLVEDAPDTRDLIVTILGQHGATVVAVDSVAAAREALARTAPSVLISDIGMRGEDGYTLIREIRKRPDAIRVIPAVALTAYAGVEDRRRALREGFDVHLAKPLEPDELVAVVADLAPARRGRSETA